jgi:putative Holliday junction resolvase
MRILGLDVGNKRIGVAVSDPLGITAQGIGVIHRKNIKEDINKISGFIKQYDVEKVLLGLPKNMNGTIGPQSELVKEFGDKIKNKLKIEVDYWDERLTSVAAERVLIDADLSRKKRKTVIDEVAAVLILQNYLEFKSSIDSN